MTVDKSVAKDSIVVLMLGLDGDGDGGGDDAGGW